MKYYDPDVLALLTSLRAKGAVELRDLLRQPVRRGKSPPKEEYNSDENSDVIVVKAGNIGHVSLGGSLDTIPETIYDRLRAAQLEENDVLLASTGDGTLGKAAVYNREQRAVADGHVAIIKVIERVLPDYLVWYLRSEYGQMQIHRLYTGSTGLIELPEDAVPRILVIVPSDLDKQRQMVASWLDEITAAEAIENAARERRRAAERAFLSAVLPLDEGPSPE